MIGNCKTVSGLNSGASRKHGAMGRRRAAAGAEPAIMLPLALALPAVAAAAPTAPTIVTPSPAQLRYQSTDFIAL